MFRRSVLGLMITGASFGVVSVQAAPTTEELLELIKQQQKEIDELKKLISETSNAIKETDMKVEATADAVEAVAENGASSANWASKTFIGGYGEHHYNNFDKGNDQIDAHRFVLFVGHEFSDSVRFFSELELEHSLAGEGKPGEVELEQAFIEWQFSQSHSLIAGQFLVPVGILNETHEPETFYGVERNIIEKNIIPATWWETGVMLAGELAPGLQYNLAWHSGLETSADSSIRSGRQKSAKAVANDFAYTGRLKYTGVPGLELAATLQYQEDITQGLYEEAGATLFETHAIYNAGPFGLRALWASWDIDGNEFGDVGKDSQEGWYVEPSFKVTDNLGLFVRYSSWDLTAGLAGSESNEVVDIGLNYWLTERVVFKADYQDASDYNENDSLNLGVGWSF